MSILTNIFQNTIGRVLPSSARSQSTKGVSQDQGTHKENAKESISNLRRRKREHSNDFEERFEIITKRLRVDNERYAPIVKGQMFESAAIEGLFAGPMTTNLESTKDRALMPPPSLSPLKSKMDTVTYEAEMTESSMDYDNTSHLSQSQRPLNEFSDEYSMEKARRHALATSLPPNSGLWESSERDLFYHLSYRGFEPLFPENWMQDFETLPLSLYATAATAEPLIQNHTTKEFRAIRELRELLNLGKNVRDKVLASPSVKKETIIERATKKYISWALSDVGIKLPSSTKSAKNTVKSRHALPIHVIVKLKNRQTTAEGVLELKHKLHVLASQHRQVRNIRISIENDTGYHTPDATEDETHVIESSDDDLPVLYGIIICRSILAVFTMNSQTPPPRNWKHPTTKHHRTYHTHHPSPAPSEPVFSDTKGRQSITSTHHDNNTIFANSISDTIPQVQASPDIAMSYGDDDNDSASDPRFISDFDFSDSKRDVWNALVIAIVAMQIRKDMLLLQKNYDRWSDPMDEVTAGIEVASVTDIMNDDEDDDPDL